MATSVNSERLYHGYTVVCVFLIRWKQSAKVNPKKWRLQDNIVIIMTIMRVFHDANRKAKCPGL